MTQTPSDVVADRVRALRRELRWSAERLAEEGKAQGFAELTASVIANLESGRPLEDGSRRRKITVDELVALSLVLSVPPIALLLPWGLSDEFKVGPNAVANIQTFYEWLIGKAPLGKPSPAAWSRATDAVKALGDFSDALAEAKDAFRAVKAESYVGHPGAVEQARARHLRACRELANIADVLASLGQVAPEPRQSELGDLAEMGIEWPRLARMNF